MAHDLTPADAPAPTLHAVALRHNGQIILGQLAKSPECAVRSLSPFEGAEVVGLVNVEPEPITGMAFVLREIGPNARPRVLRQASPSYGALQVIAQSVAGALQRAGVTDCDDPGEAIDVMRERYEARIAALTPSAQPDGNYAVVLHPDGVDAQEVVDMARGGTTVILQKNIMPTPQARPDGGEAGQLSIEEAFRVAEELTPLPPRAREALQALKAEVLHRWEQRTALSFRLQDLRAIAVEAGIADDSPLYGAIHDVTATAEAWMHPGTLSDAASAHLSRLKRELAMLRQKPVLLGFDWAEGCGPRHEATIVLPKGCSCKDVEFGSYANQVELPTPAHMLELGSIGCYEFRPTTCVDRCIAPLVEQLWAAGVVTTGSCCGHNKRDGYIGVHQPQGTTEESSVVGGAR